MTKYFLTSNVQIEYIIVTKDTNMEIEKYTSEFTKDTFWDKLKGNFSKISNSTIEMALTLYYAFRDEETPTWAKSVIAGALGYFIFPLDAVPDLLPMLGYSDDIMVLTAAITTIGFNIKDRHKEKAKATIKNWFYNLND